MTTGTKALCRALAALAVVTAFPATASAEIRPEHPRILFTADDLPAIRQRCRGSHKEIWGELKSWMDSRLKTEPRGQWQTSAVARNMGFVWRVTGEDRYARAGVRMLRRAVEYHLQKVRRRLSAANWEAVELRRYNYVAYDWLYDAMTEKERAEIGRALFEIADLHAKQNKWNHSYAGGYNRYENDFYCGLALFKSGVDDAKAETYLKSGFDFLLNQTIAGRNQVATDDGGIQSGMGYALYNYIPVESHFLSSWKSATGEDLFDRDKSLRYFPVWALYTITPNNEAPPICDIGGGNILSEKNVIGSTRVNANGLRLYLSLVASRYRDRRAAHLVPEPRDYYSFHGPEDILWRDPAIRPVSPGPELPRGRHFEGLGWVAMRTGWKPDSVYSVFTCSDYYYGHKHRDINHFVIYYKGYLAADARKRIYQASGHNTLLVFGEGNDGDQRRPHGDSMYRHKDPIDPSCDMGDIVAFETNPHYVYVCGDGTKAYSVPRGVGGRAYKPQLESFTRQYLFLLPRTFVVYDRVVSVRADARKVWQLHSWTEPELRPPFIVTRQGEGQMFCRTLLPEKPIVKKDFQRLVGAERTRANLWRATVERTAPAKIEEFLHVLYVTDAADPQKPAIEFRRSGGAVEVSISADGLRYRGRFSSAGAVGGQVTISRGDTTLIDGPLTARVQPQEGYGLAEVTVAERPPPARGGKSIWALASEKLRARKPKEEEVGAEAPALDEARALAAKGDYEAAALRLQRETPSEVLKAFAAGFGAAKEMRSWIMEGASAGRQESVFVDLMGIRMRGKVVAADEDSLTVAILGRESRMEWSGVSPPRFLSLARKYAREGAGIEAEKADVLRLFSRACGLDSGP